MDHTSFKITSHVNKILSLIRSNPLTVVIAPPGYGKSIGLPLSIAETQSRVFVSVSQPSSAQALYDIQSKNSSSVGLGTHNHTNYNHETQIVYVTDTHIKDKLLHSFRDEGAMAFAFTIVRILDDIHICSIETSLFSL